MKVLNQSDNVILVRVAQEKINVDKIVTEVGVDQVAQAKCEVDLRHNLEYPGFTHVGPKNELDFNLPRGKYAQAYVTIKHIKGDPVYCNNFTPCKGHVVILKEDKSLATTKIKDMDQTDSEMKTVGPKILKALKSVFCISLTSRMYIGNASDKVIKVCVSQRKEITDEIFRNNFARVGPLRWLDFLLPKGSSVAAFVSGADDDGTEYCCNYIVQSGHSIILDKDGVRKAKLRAHIRDQLVAETHGCSVALPTAGKAAEHALKVEDDGIATEHVPEVEEEDNEEEEEVEDVEELIFEIPDGKHYIGNADGDLRWLPEDITIRPS